MTQTMTAPAIDPRLDRAAQPLVKVRDMAMVLFDRPDLQKARAFLQDFGLTVALETEQLLLMTAAGGYGPCYHVQKADRPAFRGLGFALHSEDDLQKLAGLDGASAIEDAPGYDGGKQVRLTDPAGFEVRAIFGPHKVAEPTRSPLPANLTDKPRINEGHRPGLAPANVLRLGHVAINRVDFFANARWYMDIFGLIPSDIQTIGDNDPALVFMRCDLGDSPADHHTLVIAQGVEDGFSHCAFEVIDLDDLAMGSEHLKAQGHKQAWGIGRHILGSQVFDYWRDPWGDKVEHFIDGDLYTADRPTDVSPMSMSSIYQWGPQIPKDFEAPKMTPGFILRMIRNIRQSPEMTFDRFKALMAATKE